MSNKKKLKRRMAKSKVKKAEEVEKQSSKGVSIHLTSFFFRSLDLEDLCADSIDHLLCKLQNNTAVNYIHVNSTLGRHFPARNHKQYLDHPIISGRRGKALIICTRQEREGWEGEYQNAKKVLRDQFGLQVRNSSYLD